MELGDNSIILDANIWIAYFDKDDSLSSRAKPIIQFGLEKSNSILVPDFILQEVATVYIYKGKSNLAKLFFSFIEKQPNIITVSIDSEFLKEICTFMQQRRFRPKISLTDWSLVFLHHQFDLKVHTFDKQLSNTLQRIKTVQ